MYMVNMVNFISCRNLATRICRKVIERIAGRIWRASIQLRQVMFMMCMTYMPDCIQSAVHAGRMAQ